MVVLVLVLVPGTKCTAEPNSINYSNEDRVVYRTVDPAECKKYNEQESAV